MAGTIGVGLRGRELPDSLAKLDHSLRHSFPSVSLTRSQTCIEVCELFQPLSAPSHFLLPGFSCWILSWHLLLTGPWLTQKICNVCNVTRKFPRHTVKWKYIQGSEQYIKCATYCVKGKRNKEYEYVFVLIGKYSENLWKWVTAGPGKQMEDGQEREIFVFNVYNCLKEKIQYLWKWLQIFRFLVALKCMAHVHINPHSRIFLIDFREREGERQREREHQYIVSHTHPVQRCHQNLLKSVRDNATNWSPQPGQHMFLIR